MAVTISGSAGIARPLGSAGSPSDVNTSDSTTGLYFPSSNTVGISTGGTNALYIDASQNVGIGTSGPSYKLHVVNSSAGATVYSAVQNTNATASSNASFLALATGTNNYSTFGQATDLNTYITNAAAGGLLFSANGSERMRIDSSGNVGIGTSSPGQKLVVAGNIQAVNGNIYASGANSSSYAVFDVSNPSGVEVQIGANGNSYGDFRVVTNHPALFYTNNTERMRIDTSGNVLVGTTDSGQTSGTGIKLNSNSAYISVVSAGSTNATDTYHLYSTGASAYRFYVDLAGTIHATSAIISAISDQRLKENVTDLDVGLNAILALKPRKFDWKEGKGKNIKGDRGFIAQEFEQVFPDLIDEWKDPAPEGEEPYKSVRFDLIPVLVKAIQELKAEFDAYKAAHP